MASSQQEKDNHTTHKKPSPSPEAVPEEAPSLPPPAPTTTATVMNYPSSSSDAATGSAAEMGIVPQLAHHQITYQDLDIAIRVLNAVASLNKKNNRSENNNGHNRCNKSQQKQQQNKKRPPSAAAAADDAPNEPNDQEADKCSHINDDNGDTNNNNNNTDETTYNSSSSTSDGLDLYKHRNLRPFRKSLAACLELHKRTMYDGMQEDAYYQQQYQKRTLKRQKTAETAQQQKYIATTALRRGRIEKLQQLQKNISWDEEEGKEDYKKWLIPDGHVDTTTTAAAAAISASQQQQQQQSQQQRFLENDSNAKTNDNDDNNNSNSKEEEVPLGVQKQQYRLPKLRSCYVCKVRYRELHPFYDQLCPTCAVFNWNKRHQTCNLTGRVAVVTGARVKIGYQVCLKLLRAGCHVIATTRFPNAAAAAYRQEKDFDEWKHRLQIYGLDLRDVTGLEAFTRFLKLKYDGTGIDILINNACQTIRRPAGYYTPIVQQEQTLWNQADDTHKAILGECMEFERLRRQILLEHKQDNTSNSHHQQGKKPPAVAAQFGRQDTLSMATSSSSSSSDMHRDGATPIVTTTASSVRHQAESNEALSAVMSYPTATAAAAASSKECTSTYVPFESTGLSHSAAMSQMIILPEDAGVSDSILPPGVTDVNGQQLDLRQSNSWLLKMEEVSTPEIMECMFVNAIAPFVLNSRLKPLMTIPHDDDSRPDRYIINVSAMEGKFYRYKMPNHPHTNMAKAALNMLTRTSAEDLATKHRIYMNSVDTGWINDENPLERASQTAKNNHFQTPIDEIDAAARILDPIFMGVNSEKGTEKQYGMFLKDYHVTEW